MPIKYVSVYNLLSNLITCTTVLYNEGDDYITLFTIFFVSKRFSGQKQMKR